MIRAGTNQRCQESETLNAFTSGRSINRTLKNASTPTQKISRTIFNALVFANGSNADRMTKGPIVGGYAKKDVRLFFANKGSVSS